MFFLWEALLGCSILLSSARLGIRIIGLVYGHNLFHVCAGGIVFDRSCWKLVKSKGLEVRGFYHSLYPLLLSSHFLGKWVKILSIGSHRKQRIIVIDWCCMCKQCVESVDHLLLHCPIAYELWIMVFSLFGIHWAMPQRVIELFA